MWSCSALNSNSENMKFVKILAVASFAVASLGLSSCGCCSGEAPLPSLRRLPSFKDIPVGQDAPAAKEAASADDSSDETNEVPVQAEK